MDKRLCNFLSFVKTLKFFSQMYDMWINCKSYVYNIELTMWLIKHMKPNEIVEIIWINLFQKLW
jgi:hypothetical protein